MSLAITFMSTYHADHPFIRSRRPLINLYFLIILFHLDHDPVALISTTLQVCHYHPHINYILGHLILFNPLECINILDENMFSSKYKLS